MQIHFALSRAAAVGGRRASRQDGDRAPDARARRRLARGQRGRARAAAGRGDDRRRAAADDGPVARARGRRGCSGSSCRSCRGASRATRRASSTSATARGRRSCASATPTASRRGSRGTSRTSSRRSSPRTCLSPADLQAANINLVHGDPYGGSLALDQNFLWRPLASQPGHRTPVDGVWHVGASTHPGPGPRRRLGALVAQQLLEPPFAKRMLSRLRGSG